jgi:hypothetical protein
MKRRDVVVKLCLFFFACLFIFSGLAAHSSADSVVAGYKSKGDLQTGYLVALVKGSQDTVEAVPPNGSDRIYGVVIDPSDAPLTLNRQVDGQVFVATTGNYPVIVSTERGKIRAGDYLSISSNAGIAASASNSQKTIIGQAVEAFDGKKGAITTSGNVSIGKVLTNIDPRRNPISNSDVFVPSFLKTVGEGVAGKPVTAQRIYLSLIFLIAAVGVGAWWHDSHGS